jgi:phosphohistidine phosphatase
MIKQSGAIPIRFQNAEPLFLVINNRNKTRWLVPKGVIENGQTPVETAVKEVMEEAGVAGEIWEQPLGAYMYRKWEDICSVDLFVLFVDKIYENWEEDYFRQRRWINWQEFMEVVDERIPRSILDKIPHLLNSMNDLNKKEKEP